MKRNLRNNKKNQGFTLIEALVYLVLFGLLMSGAIVAAYNIFESGNRNSAKILIQEEGNFLLAKISWALSGISAVNSPALGSTNSKLLVTTVDPAIGSLDIELSGQDMILVKSGVTKTLNNSNTKINNLLFDYEYKGGVEWITSSFKLNTLTADGKPWSQDFQNTKYLRK